MERVINMVKNIVFVLALKYIIGSTAVEETVMFSLFEICATAA